MPKPIQPRKPKVTIVHLHKHLLEQTELLYSIKTVLEDTLTKIGIDITHILKNQKSIMADQKQAAEDLKAVSAKLTKIGQESATLLEKITALEAAAGQAGEVSPELQTAIDEVKTQAQVVDDLVPDAETPTA